MNATPEEWRPVVGYEGSYEVSSEGRVRSLDRIITRIDGQQRALKGKLLKPSPSSPDGRYLVSLGFGNSNKRLVHRLVAEAFIGPRPEGLETCHNDGDCLNNRATNLRYDTHSANGHDKVRHGRDYNANKTHCKCGQEYTPENTLARVLPDGTNQRICRTCKRRYNREAKARAKAKSVQ